MGLPDLDRRTVLATFERALVTDPDGVAQIDRAGRWSTAEAFARSRRIGGGLAALGVRADTPVGLMVDNSFDATHTWMGLALLGAVQVPVNTAYRGTFLAHVLHDSGVEILVLEAGYAERVAAVADALPRVRTLVVHGDVEQARAALPLGRFDVVAWPELEATREADPVRRGPGDLMAIMYTSGTTGRAKGVLVPHAHAYTYASREDQERPRRGDRSLVTLPTFHLAGQWYGVYQALIHTIACVLEPGVLGERVLGDGPRARHHLHHDARGDGRAARAAPAHPRRRRQRPRARDHGAARERRRHLPPPLRHRSRRGLRDERGRRRAHGPPDTVVGGEAGFPREGYALRLVDSDGEPVGPGAIGELLVRPDLPHTVMAGYHGLPDATARTVIDGWVHTGDAFRTDAEGRWFFTDRMKDALRRRGENISSFEVESTVNEHPDVYESAVVAVPADVGEDEIKVVVVPQEGAAIDREQLTRFLIDRLPYFMVPRYVELADALPKTPTHKVQKAVLRDRGLDGDVWDREAAGIVLRRTTPGAR